MATDRALIVYGETDSGASYFFNMGTRWKELFEALGIPCDELRTPTRQQVEAAIPGHNILVIQAHGNYHACTIQYGFFGVLEASSVRDLMANPKLVVLEVCDALWRPTWPNSWTQCMTRTSGALLGHTRGIGNGPGGLFWDMVCARLLQGDTVGEAFAIADASYDFPWMDMQGDPHVRLTAVAPQTYYLSTGVMPSGSGTVSPSGGNCAAGSLVVITAIPASGYVFSHWSGGATGSQNPVTVVMDRHKGVFAHFVQEQPQPEPAAAIWNMAGTPRVVNQGDTVAVGFTLKNIGTIAWIFGAHVALRRPDGTTLAPGVKPVGLIPGQIGVAGWTYTADQPGLWDIACSVWKETVAPYETRLATNEWVEDFITVNPQQGEMIPMPTAAQRQAFIDSLNIPGRLDVWLESL